MPEATDGLSVRDLEVRARRIFDGVLGGRTEVALGSITREFERALGHETTTRFTAQLLRGHGLKRSGWQGSGYDREPVYTKKEIA